MAIVTIGLVLFSWSGKLVAPGIVGRIFPLCVLRSPRVGLRRRGARTTGTPARVQRHFRLERRVLSAKIKGVEPDRRAEKHDLPALAGSVVAETSFHGVVRAYSVNNFSVSPAVPVRPSHGLLASQLPDVVREPGLCGRGRRAGAATP